MHLVMVQGTSESKIPLKPAAAPNMCHPNRPLALHSHPSNLQGHAVLIPLDGCSINPARRWGTAGDVCQLHGVLRGMHECPLLVWTTVGRPAGGTNPHPGLPPFLACSFGPALVANRWKDFWGEASGFWVAGAGWGLF